MPERLVDNWKDVQKERMIGQRCCIRRGTAANVVVVVLLLCAAIALANAAALGEQAPTAQTNEQLAASNTKSEHQIVNAGNSIAPKSDAPKYYGLNAQLYQNNPPSPTTAMGAVRPLSVDAARRRVDDRVGANDDEEDAIDTLVKSMNNNNNNRRPQTSIASATNNADELPTTQVKSTNYDAEAAQTSSRLRSGAGGK